MHTTLKCLAAMAACTLFATNASAQSAKKAIRRPSIAIADGDASPSYGVTIPPGHRQWSSSHRPKNTGRLDELRGILGNALSMKAYREGTRPFPDGAILAKLAWKHVPPAEADGAYVPGHSTTVQFIVKDSRKYALSRRLGIRSTHRRQASGRGAAQNLFRLPLGSCERPRLRL